MKLAQYTQREIQITTTDINGIRQRWLWGLRVLNDPQMFSNGSRQLKPGVGKALSDAAAKRDIKLSEREIQYRLACARAYPTEAEFRTACAEFPTWFDLRTAGFPPYKVPPDEPPADWRTDAEKTADRNRAWLDMTNGMDSMFPLRDFEPVETTLEDLETYMKEQQQINENFLATYTKRRAYLDRLEDAVGHDLSKTWQEAHDLLPAEDDDGDGS